jgi:hypothetical protein
MRTRDKVGIWAFAALLAAHWLEHAFQAYQVYVMHMERSCALGMLGMRYPWLVRTESLHFGFAVVTTVGLLMLWHVFAADGRTWGWWTAATLISIWHLFEHSLLFYQATVHHNFFGSPVPTSIIQLFVPRIELHLFYNSLVTIPIVVAMVLNFQQDRKNRIIPLVA